MKKTIVLLIAIAGIVATLFTVSGCWFTTSQPKNTVRIGIVTWAGFGTAIVGEEKGFFGDIKIVNRVLDDADARHAAFRSGQLDIMISSIDLLAQEHAQGIEGEILLVTDQSWGCDGIVASEAITTAKDLKGKTVAFARGTPSQFLLYKVLQEAGLTFDDIKQIVVSDPSLAAQAFMGGSADAAATWEPFISEVIEKRQGKVLATSADVPDAIIDILVCNKEFAKNPELIQKFLDGWFKSLDYIQQHPEESKEILAKGFNIGKDDVEGMMAGIKYADKLTNAEFFQSGQLDQIYDDALIFWKSQKIIQNDTTTKGNILNQTAKDYFHLVK